MNIIYDEWSMSIWIQSTNLPYFIKNVWQTYVEIAFVKLLAVQSFTLLYFAILTLFNKITLDLFH